MPEIIISRWQNRVPHPFAKVNKIYFPQPPRISIYHQRLHIQAAQALPKRPHDIFRRDIPIIILIQIQECPSQTRPRIIEFLRQLQLRRPQPLHHNLFFLPVSQRKLRFGLLGLPADLSFQREENLGELRNVHAEAGLFEVSPGHEEVVQGSVGERQFELGQQAHEVLKSDKSISFRIKLRERRRLVPKPLLERQTDHSFHFTNH